MAVIMLRTGIEKNGRWLLFIFRRGLRSTPTMQAEPFGSDNYHCTSRVDLVDRRRYMLIREDCLEDNKKLRSYYRWDGIKFRYLFDIERFHP